MTKRKKSSLLQGVPFNIQYLHRAPGDPVRDKRLCVYFKDGWCKQVVASCFGSSHCDYYREWLDGEKLYTKQSEMQEQERVKIKRAEAIKKKPDTVHMIREVVRNVHVPYKVGDKLYHKNYKVGTITSIKNDVIMVDFDGNVKRFMYPTSFKNGIMETYSIARCPLSMGEYVTDKKYGEGYVSNIEYGRKRGQFNITVKYLDEGMVIRYKYPNDFRSENNVWIAK